MIVLLSKKLKMGMFNRHFCLALLSGFALTICVPVQGQLVQGQSGFTSLDCGLPEDSSYTDPNTTLFYMSDATFVDTGIIKNIAPEYKTNDLQLPLWNVRSFPEGIRNCYYINGLTAGVRYLIRGTFMYGNYDEKGKLPEFELHLGANMWDTVQLDTPSSIIYREIIHVAPLDYIHVCLVNTDHGTPFISALELRTLRSQTYVTKSGSLVRPRRHDSGSITNQTFRYKDDIYDRIWKPATFFYYRTSLNTSRTMRSETDYEPASAVMTTAATPVNSSHPLKFRIDTNSNETSQFYVYMYFAEVEELQANQSRAFNIYLNGDFWFGPVIPSYLSTTPVYTRVALSGGKYNFLINKTENSTLPPIINAIEIYQVKELFQSETDQVDVDAITKIKSVYGITSRNWQGDPCAPKDYLWDGLNCTYDGFHPPRIISLKLSSSGLTGEIPSSISNLKMIRILDLSNNSLTGQVPDFLSQLPSLTVLNLERNKLTGSVPTDLIKRSDDCSLTLSVGENPNLCSSVSCKKKKNITVPIVASVGGFFILLLTAAAIFWVLKRRKQQGFVTGNTVSKHLNDPIESKQREFTYSDIMKITNNFDRVLGKGGFGTVYHGNIDDTQVAVKMLSPSSIQGYQQFHAEVNLLMRVHHRNLTILVGYCNEGTDIGLVYEYMANGDLSSHLSGSSANIFSWEDRLRIALDAAQGLEYLHNGCKPPIIHRDVKCTNILLDENFHAKLGDFGLSKAFPTDSSNHLSTIAVGTPGYLDPEYYTENWLTEKSDVYSFGVVLLEIITNQLVISKTREKAHITQWVGSLLAKGDIKSIVDPKLRGDFDTNSVCKAVEIAMVCVSETSNTRPTMNQVMVELKECLAIELGRTKKGDDAEEKDSIGFSSPNPRIEFRPLPR